MEQETDEPKKCTCKHGKIIAVILVVLIVAICCHIHHLRQASLMPGTYYIVQFRGDVLGTPVSPRDDNYNNIEGTLIAVNREAILLDRYVIVNDEPQMLRLWIPKSNILLIKPRTK